MDFNQHRVSGLFRISVMSPIAIAVWASCAQAQVIPDRTLTAPSTVTSQGSTFTIEGGTTAGSNLFHSFQEFSVPTDTEALFNNATNIENIITRVTGSSISNIDGLIGANGKANLFLLNPNGIVFGPNARLDIGGSFIGSTANSLQLSDGSFFNATEPNAPPLLRVNVPIGLQFGPTPGAIAVEGTGHSLSIEDGVPINRGSSDKGLRVRSGNTLALLGGNITLEGSTLSADSGRIELGSVEEGRVSLIGTAQGWISNYDGVKRFRDIQFTRSAFADASGAGSGSIQVQGRQISLLDGSVLLIQQQGIQSLGNININASESLLLKGSTPDTTIQSRLTTETVAAGNGADITLSTPQLILQDGAAILSRTLSVAKGGNISANVSESVQLLDSVPTRQARVSIITTQSFAPGSAGDLNLSTTRLLNRNGGAIASTNFGSGSSGTVTVNATESIELIGMSPIAFAASNVAASTLGSGSGGNVTINTPRLVLRDGGSLSSSNVASGDSGSVTINASEFVEVSGKLPGSPSPSKIDTSGVILSPFLREILGLPPQPSGASGNVTINTPVLRVSDGGLVTVRNDGSGDAGNLTIGAGSIFLDRLGNISASTQSGQGGNIILQARNSLQLRNGSQITAAAGNRGNGGNLSIDASTIVALENSDISANAFEGNGGNIQITTQGIFGTQFRLQQTPLSDITASSDFGVSGNVTLNTPDVNPRSGLVELPAEISDSSQQIIAACAAKGGNTFTVTGRGGLPSDPTVPFSSEEIWQDWGDYLAQNQQANSRRTHPTEGFSVNSLRQIVEATTWKVNAQGQVVLVATASHSNLYFLQHSNCHAL
ncbi:filamentous hemagglutinin N-terminal domain-containing protein [Argonema antarcticum]|uniref:two-partner secretion domain-containing protein n=1 Tax=Argonema antarcticum TaxID=2942763 RepID=UPI0020139809|nr:filamentous hemagglutinin N-terminal domain-containing protein [Argonema antarcticum]MCL1470670.1 S-layer family protein [Argonema antarcticum A004/B2]